MNKSPTLIFCRNIFQPEILFGFKRFYHSAFIFIYITTKKKSNTSIFSQWNTSETTTMSKFIRNACDYCRQILHVMEFRLPLIYSSASNEEKNEMKSHKLFLVCENARASCSEIVMSCVLWCFWKIGNEFVTFWIWHEVEHIYFTSKAL